MSICSYNGKRLIPCPFVGISKEFNQTGDQLKIGSVFVFNIIGKMLSFKGSPDSTGTFWTVSGYPPDEAIQEDSKLASIFRKQEAIRTLFSEEGKSLEFQSADGSGPIKANIRNIKITFSDALWNQTCDYTITCEADILYINGTSVGEDNFPNYISEASESWSMDTNADQPENAESPRTYILTHSISATGKRSYNETGVTSEAYQNAKSWVLPKLGINSAFVSSSGVSNLPSYYTGYNHVRTENSDVNGGQYAITESWMLASGTALEDFTININSDRQSALKSVSIQGEIRGLETRDSNMNLLGSKHYHADVKWNQVSSLLHARSQLYSGYTLNATPLATSKSVNPVGGVITYNYEYDNRPSHIVSDTLMENISINHSYNVDAFAAIFVLGRTNGSLLQSLGTKREKSVSISIDLVMNFVQSTGDKSLGTLKTYFTSSKPSLLSPYSTQIQSIIDANNPLNYGYTKVFTSENTENWTPNNGAYSRQVTFVYE